MTISDPGYYAYAPITDRPLLTWPGNARVAVWVAPNIEFYELQPPENPLWRAWPRGQPDILGYSYRDYGNRVGVWRVLEVLARYGMRGSVALNVALADHHPEIIEACQAAGWEFFSHGIYNTRYLYGMDEAQERNVIEDAIATVLRHAGQRIVGWLSPALSNTERTIGLLAEYGFAYVCDLFHDDQPFPLKVPGGRLISLPYALETNDGTVYGRRLASPREYGDILRAQFDQLTWKAPSPAGSCVSRCTHSSPGGLTASAPLIRRSPTSPRTPTYGSRRARRSPAGTTRTTTTRWSPISRPANRDAARTDPCRYPLSTSDTRGAVSAWTTTGTPGPPSPGDPR